MLIRPCRICADDPGSRTDVRTPANFRVPVRLQAARHGGELEYDQPAAEKLSAVIPGRREAADPESRKAGNPDVLDSGFAPSTRPGMTAKSFSAAANAPWPA